MDIRLTKATDEKSKATIYTLTKTDDNKKSALIRVIDFGNNGLDNTDSIVVKGETSVFTNDEIKSNLLNGYQNTNTKSNLPEADYSETNGKLNIGADKEYSLGSVAKILGVNPATTPTSTAAASTPAQAFPNIAALSTGMPMLDTSLFEGYGMAQTGASMPGFDMDKYQKAMKSFTGIGALAGVLSSLGGDCDFFSSTLIPMLAGSMLPKVGNFFTSAPTAPAASAAATTAAANTSATAPTSNTTAQSSASTAPGSTTGSAPVSAPVSTVGTSSVAEADKAYKELTKAKSEKSKVTTVYYHDGTIAEKFTDEKTGDRIIDHRAGKGGKTLSRVRYFKGTHDSRAEFFDGDKNGLIIKTYTEKETGKRVAEQYKRVSEKTIKYVKKTYFTGKAADETKTKTKEAVTGQTSGKLEKKLALLEEQKKVIKSGDQGCMDFYREYNKVKLEKRSKDLDIYNKKNFENQIKELNKKNETWTQLGEQTTEQTKKDSYQKNINANNKEIQNLNELVKSCDERLAKYEI